MIKNAPYGMSGYDGTVAWEKELEENSCCGVNKGHSGQDKDAP